MQYKIEGSTIFNPEFSGSTITSVFLSGNQMFALNIGDSRTILVSEFEKEVLVS